MIVSGGRSILQLTAKGIARNAKKAVGNATKSPRGYAEAARHCLFASCALKIERFLSTDDAFDTFDAGMDSQMHYADKTVASSSPRRNQYPGRTKSRKRLFLDNLHFLLDLPVGEMNVDIWKGALETFPHVCDHNPELAEKLLKRMMEEAILNHARLYVHISSSLVSRCIKSWALAGSVQRASRCLEFAKEKHQAHPDICEFPNIYCFNALIMAYRHNTKEPVQDVMDIVDFLEKSKDSSLKPNFYTYNMAMAAVGRDDNGSAEKAENLLFRFATRFRDGLVNKGPSVVSFNTVIKAYTLENMDRAFEIYKLMYRLAQTGCEDLEPTELTLRILLRGYTRYADYRGAMRAMNESSVSGNLTECCNAVLLAIARSKEENAAALALKFFANNFQNGNAEPTEKTYRFIVQAHANETDPRAPGLVLGYLMSLVNRFKENKLDVVPSLSMFNIALKHMIRYEQNLTREATMIWNEIKALSSDFLVGIAPNSETYSLLFLIFCQSGDDKMLLACMREANKNSRHLETASINEGLQKLLKRNARGRVSHSRALAALAVLDEARNGTDMNTYNIILTGFSYVHDQQAMEKALSIVKKLEAKDERNVQLQVITYCCILDGLARLGGKRNLRMAMDIFDRMKKYDSDTSRQFQLTPIAYQKILSFLAREAPEYDVSEETKYILDDMLVRVSPFSHSLAFAIRAIVGDASNLEKVAEAQSILLDLIERFRWKKLERAPQSFIFAELLKVWSDAGADDKVSELCGAIKELLETESSRIPEEQYATLLTSIVQGRLAVSFVETEKMLESMGIHDVTLWNMLLDAWASSNSENKVEECRRIFDQMHMIDEVSFNTLLKAIASSEPSCPEQKANELRLAEGIFNRMTQTDSIEPNHDTYRYMISSYLNLMAVSEEKKKRKNIEYIFEACCQRGFASSLIVHKLLRAFNPEELDVKWNIRKNKMGEIDVPERYRRRAQENM